MGWIVGVVAKWEVQTKFWIGIIIALLGAVVMSVGGTEEVIQSGSLLGDALATLAGFLGSVYLIATKEVRASVPVHAYSAAVCLFTAVFLFAVGWTQDVDVTSDMFISPWVVLAMALGPQLFGHVGLTWCLERIQASTVALGLLLEPVGAAFLAWWWFSEAPTFAETIGAGVILIGFYSDVASACRQKHRDWLDDNAKQTLQKR